MTDLVYAVTFGMTSTTMYYYTKVMSELFLDAEFEDTGNTFRGITTMQDFWRVCYLAKTKLKVPQVSSSDLFLTCELTLLIVVFSRASGRWFVLGALV